MTRGMFGYSQIPKARQQDQEVSAVALEQDISKREDSHHMQSSGGIGDVQSSSDPRQQQIPNDGAKIAKASQHGVVAGSTAGSLPSPNAPSTSETSEFDARPACRNDSTENVALPAGVGVQQRIGSADTVLEPNAAKQEDMTRVDHVPQKCQVSIGKQQPSNPIASGNAKPRSTRSASSVFASAKSDENFLLKQDPECCYIYAAEELEDNLVLTIKMTLQEGGEKEKLLLSGNGRVPILPPIGFQPVRQPPVQAEGFEPPPMIPAVAQPAPAIPVEIAIRDGPIQKAFVGVECTHAVLAHDAPGQEIFCLLCWQRI